MFSVFLIYSCIVPLLQASGIVSDPSCSNTNSNAACLITYLSLSQFPCSPRSKNVCCLLRAEFESDSWTDISKETSYSLARSCYRNSASTSYYLRIKGEGTPNHPYSTPMKVDDQGLDKLIPVNPTADSLSEQDEDDATLLGFGMVGLALNGVPFYNGFSTDFDFVKNNYIAVLDPDCAEEFDDCNGHPAPSGNQYHYHLFSNCIGDYTPTSLDIGNTACVMMCDSSFTGGYTDSTVDYAKSGSPYVSGTAETTYPSPIIGYMLDGFPVYGPYDSNGDEQVGRDNCGGMYDSNGDYGYYASSTFPYLIGCYGPGVYGDTDDYPDRYVTNSPTMAPTNLPTLAPTDAPTQTPTTDSPTHARTDAPTHTPTLVPTATPTTRPSHSPSLSPTHTRTMPPSIKPTYYPTNIPTHHPTDLPTIAPSTRHPTFGPAYYPSYGNAPQLSPSWNSPVYYDSPSPSIKHTISPVPNTATIPPTSQPFNPTAAPINDDSSQLLVFDSNISFSGVTDYSNSDLEVKAIEMSIFSLFEDSLSVSIQIISIKMVSMASSSLLHLFSAASKLIVEFSVSVSIANGDDANEMYDGLTSTISDSVSSGLLSTVLQSTAASLGALSLMNATASSVMIGNYSLEANDGDDDSGDGSLYPSVSFSKEFIVIVAVIIGLFVLGSCIVCTCSFCFSKRESKLGRDLRNTNFDRSDSSISLEMSPPRSNATLLEHTNPQPDMGLDMNQLAEKRRFARI